MQETQIPIPPTVFISSTVGEFRDLRSALSYELRQRGVNVLLSEAADFGVEGDRSAVEECFENIPKSDYYILLIGNERGSLFDDETSVTRQEYRVAKNHYLATGKPRLLMFLRESAIKQQGAKTSTEDSLHQASFIKEVEKPPTEGTPNYLKRFRDFEDVMVALAGSLNLGRDLRETLVRHNLANELIRNLTRMVNRNGSSAFPRHRALSMLREDVALTTKTLDTLIPLSSQQSTHLLMALPLVPIELLNSANIENSLLSGVFSTVELENNKIVGTPLQAALQQLLDDFEGLRLLESGMGGSKWEAELANALVQSRKVDPNSSKILGLDLLNIYAYYDHMENIFEGQVAVLRTLMGLEEDYHPPSRRPITPLGSAEEQAISKEKVVPKDVQQLLESGIHPFGPSPTANMLGKTREEQITRIAESIKANPQLEGIWNTLDESAITSLAEKVLDQFPESPLGNPEATT